MARAARSAKSLDYDAAAWNVIIPNDRVGSGYGTKMHPRDKNRKLKLFPGRKKLKQASPLPSYYRDEKR